jgi:hypothetical protein
MNAYEALANYYCRKFAFPEEKAKKLLEKHQGKRPLK